MHFVLSNRIISHDCDFCRHHAMMAANETDREITKLREFNVERKSCIKIDFFMKNAFNGKPQTKNLRLRGGFSTTKN